MIQYHPVIIKGFEMKMKSLLIFGIFSIILLLPATASANAGTPLVWLGMLHLVGLNLIIGNIEGLIIAILFRQAKAKTMGIMVLANYFSTASGGFGLLWLCNKYAGYFLGDEPLYRAPIFLLVVAIIAFLSTIILEWPFCLWIFRKTTNKVLKSLAASCIVQIISYAGLAALYFWVSPISIYTKLDVTRDLSFAKNKNAWVYFISTKDGDLYRIRTNGSLSEKILDTDIETKTFMYSPQLFIWSSKEKGYWDLWLCGNEVPRKNRKIRLLLEKFAKKSFTRKHTNLLGDPYDESGDVNDFNHIVFWGAEDLRVEEHPEWTVHAGFWAAEGVYAENKQEEQKLRVALETPFMMWHSRGASILPGDQVVYQLGNQIVLLDLNLRKIGLLHLGCGPVVVFE